MTAQLDDPNTSPPIREIALRRTARKFPPGQPSLRPPLRSWRSGGPTSWP